MSALLQCVAVCCSVLHSVAVCCSVLQCVAACCSMLQCVMNSFMSSSGESGVTHRLCVSENWGGGSWDTTTRNHVCCCKQREYREYKYHVIIKHVLRDMYSYVYVNMYV